MFAEADLSRRRHGEQTPYKRQGIYIEQVHLDIPGRAHVELAEEEEDDPQDQGGHHDPRPHREDHGHDPQDVQCDLYLKIRVQIIKT